MRTLPRFLATLAALLCFIPAGSAFAADPPEGVEFTRDVVYGKGGGEELKLNLARPKPREREDKSVRRPCVVVIHGGGWAAGNREGHNDITWQFAQRGYVSATVSYRFAPKHPFPAQVEDVKCAVRFLRAHGDEYGIDPKRIGAVGFSAGAHLSMMLAVMGREDGLEGQGGSPDQSSQVQAAVAYFGPTDLLSPDVPAVTLDILKKFIGGTAAERRDAYRKASPINYVTPGDAPMLLFQGTADPLVPYTQAVRMAEAMHETGVTGRVELLPGQSHGWGEPTLRHTVAATFAFFDEHLRNERTEESAGARGR
jgi:acetyl esterase/lipase